ncbi:MAG: ABC transporter substrate-binding protein [Alphaproteobacteria bacterium]|nr:ABC transporter substrate-binding protein [Alphaproteobacteria bacterium]
MSISRRVFLGSAAAVSATPILRARAEKPRIVIGVLSDLSGTYRDVTGPTSVACVHQAIADFDAAGKGLDVQVITADHQNKADIGAGIARDWTDTKSVDLIADVPNSSVALAVAQIVRQKNRIMQTNATTTVLTTTQCSPNTVMWSLDTYLLGHSTGGAMMRAGAKKWFFITADYAFGHSLEEETAKVVAEMGGTVVGRARYPFPDTTDFSSYLAQASASGAKVVAFANAGVDLVNCVKQAHEFGLPQSGLRLVPLEMFVSDAHALSPDDSAGLICSTTFYWDLNDRTRAFAKRVLARTPDHYPTMGHASTYANTLHFLKAVADMGAAAAKQGGGLAILGRMKAMPTDDDAFGKGSLRVDGRGMFPAYLVEAKKPDQRKQRWDLYKVLATTPADEVVHPLGEGGCTLGKA